MRDCLKGSVFLEEQVLYLICSKALKSMLLTLRILITVKKNQLIQAMTKGGFVQ